MFYTIFRYSLFWLLNLKMIYRAFTLLNVLIFIRFLIIGLIRYFTGTLHAKNSEYIRHGSERDQKENTRNGQIKFTSSMT